MSPETLELVHTAVRALVAMVVIIDPVGNVPVFLAITEGTDVPGRRRIARRACITSLVVLLVFLVAGNLVLSVFAVGVPAFGIAGGILLFRIAMDMLHARRSRTNLSDAEREEAIAHEDVATVPLAIPVLAGPGAITTVVVLGSQGDSPLSSVIVAAAVVISLALCYLAFINASRLAQRLGQSGLLTLTRLMGLVLAVVAVQFVLNALQQCLPGLFVAHGGTGR